jgi:protein tyrosine phosphatase (PTP) superfamily phosphohydrolase (DUF442 family)
LRLSDTVATSGQPSALQFQAIKDAGFELVVNLALTSSAGALADEGEIVARAGLAYEHIPIDFKVPDVPSALRFLELMGARRGRPTFVHCIANYRVSALMYVFRVACEGMDEPRALEDLHRLWTPNPIWQKYIEDVLALRPQPSL